MTILEIIQLALAASQSVLAGLQKSGAPEEIVSEIKAAVQGLTNAKDKAATLAELESLRTENLW